MILAYIRMRPMEGRMESVLKTIQGLMEPMRAQPGCLGFRCSRDIEDAEMMVLEERWETRDDFERHARSDGYRTILSLMEEAGEKPQVEFLEVSGVQGMETIEELRGAGTNRDEPQK